MTPDQNTPSSDKPTEVNEPVNIPVSFDTPGTSAQTTVTPTEPSTEPSSFVQEVTGSAFPSQTEPAEATPTERPDETPVMPTAAVGSPVVGSEITTGSNTAAPMTATVGHHGPRFGGKKRLFAGALSLFLLVGLSAGYVFAFYIPNKPENVWKSAMSNSGKAYDMLSQYATKNKDVKGIKVEGSYKLKGAFVSDGSLSGQSVGQDGQVSGSFSAAGLKLGFDVRALKSSGDTPDLYFKLTGLQGLGGLLGGGNPGVTSMINGVNNQWFVVDHTLFQQLGVSASDTQFTKADVDGLLNAVGAPSKNYLFTADPAKAVLVVKQTVGAEKKDGRNTYHYKVSYDKQHLGAYLTALCTSISKDKIGKLALKGQDANCSQLAKDATSSKSNGTADVWVDKRTKLIHVVRFSDPKNASNFAEIGQDYQGGDKFPFSIKINAKEGDITTVATLAGALDVKQNTLQVSGDFAIKGGDTDESGSFKLSVLPSNDTTLKVAKPANAKTLIELLNSLGLGSILGSPSGSAPSPILGYAGIQAKARDTERKTDLAALDAYINEAMSNNNGTLPTLAELNNAAWRAKNIAGLNIETMRDPDGTSSTLLGAPKAKNYAYIVGAGRSFTLVAILSDGTQYKISG